MLPITASLVLSLLPPRPPESHKGTFGTLLCLCGSLPYRGAALLAVEGALRAGAGIVQLASVEAVLAVCCVRTPECVLLPLQAGHSGGPSAENLPLLREKLDSCRALLAGPGLTSCTDTAALVRDLVPRTKGAAVLDADALNALAGGDLPCPKGGLILTPHPGEMARLAGCTIAQVEQDRPAAALRFARENSCVLVLKGHETLVAAPDGRLWKNTTGNAGMARGGSGDVLAGMIAALACAGLEPADAAVCGVFLHGLAGDLCTKRLGQTSMLPHDMLADLGGWMAANGR